MTSLNIVYSVKHPGRGVEEGRDDHHHHRPPGPGDGAEVPGLTGLADVDVSLDRQDQGQPDGGVVEELRGGLQEKLVHVAEALSPLHGVMTTSQVECVKISTIRCLLLVESEGVYEPGTGQEDGQEVAGGKGQQDDVGGGPHLGPGQHHDDQGVGEGGDEDEAGHDVPVERLDDLQRSEEG